MVGKSGASLEDYWADYGSDVLFCQVFLVRTDCPLK